MNHVEMLAAAAIGAAVLLWLALRLRQRAGRRFHESRRDALDTVQSWPPEAARIMTVAERKAYDLLRGALPGMLVLAQVPLSRFLRVPTRHSYGDWLGRVGSLSADLVVCDSGSRVLAVIDVRMPNETERSRRRHERMAKVLKAAGVGVHAWYEDELPTASEVRTLLGHELTRSAAAAVREPTPSRPAPLIPVAEMQELLAAGDMVERDVEPVPSGFFDEIEPALQVRYGSHR